MVLFFFPNGEANSCDIGTRFCGKNSFDLIDQKSDENGRILIAEPKIS